MWHASALSQLAAFGLRRVVVTAGVFDGLHLGHRQILATLFELAAAHRAAPVVITFDPHPREVLAPGRAPRLLLSTEHKLHLLARAGVSATVVLPFSAEMAALSAEDFLARHLCHGDVAVAAICVGERWRFGHGAQGDTALLARVGAARGVQVVPVPERLLDGQPISSTRTRQAIEGGQLEEAARLLGRPFAIMGRVEFGKGIATSDLHYPTANIAGGNSVFPPHGIYVATALHYTAQGPDPRRLPGVLYLGNAPTFVENAPPRPFVEMHIFDFKGDLYGELLEVEFLHFLRPDAKFADAAALRAQIATDVAAARRFHGLAT